MIMDEPYLITALATCSSACALPSPNPLFLPLSLSTLKARGINPVSEHKAVFLTFFLLTCTDAYTLNTAE